MGYAITLGDWPCVTDPGVSKGEKILTLGVGRSEGDASASQGTGLVQQSGAVGCVQLSLHH